MPDLTNGAIACLGARRNKRTRERTAPADSTQGISGSGCEPVHSPAAECVRDSSPKRAGINYSGQDLSGRDFSGQDLTRANLRGTNLTLANLSGADLTGATLRGPDFTDANLYGAFRRVGISRSDLDGATELDTVEGLVD